VLRAVVDAGTPFLICECRFHHFTGCKGQFKTPCLDDPLALLALPRVTEMYWTTRYMRHTFESTHSAQTQRHAIGGKQKPKALGRQQSVPAQRLRAWACLLLDWYRASLRNGWLEANQLVVVRHRIQEKVISGSIDPITHEVLRSGRGTSLLQERLAEREAAGLCLPYGRKAEWFMEETASSRAAGVAIPW
jgi:hypothetical protein